MKILVADDEPVSRTLLKSLLVKWGDEVVVAKDGVEAGLLLQEEDGPKLAILDWMMPGAEGVEICRQVRRAAAEHYVYILILTAKNSNEDIIAALEAGADDYLSKPVLPPVLKARLLTGRRIVELQQQLIRAREALRIEATHDSLTGLFNRPAIFQALSKEFRRADREDAPVCVALADIDHFKTINDTYGHPAGDAVLREVARRMEASIRPYDLLGRYGGEEFLLVAPGCKDGDAVKLAERIRQAVRAQAFDLSNASIAVTLSMGVAIYRHGDDEASIIPAADTALYQAKHLGRNRVELFSSASA